jgi:hypothetical protein
MLQGMCCRYRLWLIKGRPVGGVVISIICSLIIITIIIKLLIYFPLELKGYSLNILND